MKNKVLQLMFFGIFIIFNARAEPADPRIVKIKQLDGTYLTIKLIGDEYSHYYQTLDGFMIKRNKKGIFEYIKIVNSKIVLSGIKANDEESRNKEEVEFILKFQNNVNIQKMVDIINEYKLKTKSRILESKYNLSKPLSGTKKILCILIGYPNLPLTKSQTEFYNLMNQTGYNGYGSVKDFYQENSYGKLNLDITVVGPYISEYDFEYYGQNKSNGYDIRATKLATEAIIKANEDINYGDFDNDGDGILDGLHIIYAGHAESVAGNNPSYIWPHQSSISQNLDGVIIDKYSCSSELRGGETNVNICGIGTICHELGHVFGAPDFYDTNYSLNGKYEGTGRWDLMAHGSWNNSGDTPAHHNPYTKTEIFGWATIKDLPNSGAVTLNPAETHSNSFYKMNTNTVGEYFILENRQKLGFDNNWSFPGHGLMVYHVHSQFSPTSQNNNITHPQKFYPVCASATQNPNSTPSSYGVIDSGGCPFPGYYDKHYFNSTTIPSLISWAGESTNKNIYFIEEISNDIAFILNPKISGSNTICNQETYTIENASGISFTWQTSSNLQIVSSTNSSVTVKKVDNGSGYIKAVYGDVEIKKLVWINLPHILSIFEEMQQNGTSFIEPLCHSYTYEDRNKRNITVNGETIDFEWRKYHGDFDFLAGNGTTIWFRPRNSNSVSIEVRAKNKCGWSEWVYLPYQVIDCDNNNDMFSIYPNPASGTVTIQLEETEESSIGKLALNNAYRIDIYNMSGYMVRSVTAKENEVQIPLQGLLPGIYAVHLVKDGKVYKKKLIVE